MFFQILLSPSLEMQGGNKKEAEKAKFQCPGGAGQIQINIPQFPYRGDYFIEAIDRKSVV